MNQRKLIRLGNSSFAIALPKTWVNKSGLSKGDNIFINENSNGELIIYPEFQKGNGEKRVTLNFEDKEDKEMEREISSAYIQDYNVFEVRGIESKKRNYVEHLLKSLISLEIIEKNKDSLIAKDFLDLNEVNIENFLRRIDNSLRNMFEELETYFKKGVVTNKEVKEIYEIDWDINRLYFLVYRIFIKGLNNPSVLTALGIDALTLLNSWQISVEIEQIADELKRSCKLISQGKALTGKERESIYSLFLDTKKIYLEMMSGYYNKDAELVKKVTFYKDEKQKKCDEVAKSPDPTVAKVAEKFKHVLSNINQVSKLILYTLDSNDK